MDKYDIIETYEYGIDIYKLIRTIWHLQYDEKQDIMTAVENYKQVYMFYQSPYQSNADYLESFKVDIKVSKAHNGAVGYHLILADISLQYKQDITSDTSNEDQDIEANINAR